MTKYEVREVTNDQYRPFRIANTETGEVLNMHYSTREAAEKSIEGMEPDLYLFNVFFGDSDDAASYPQIEAGSPEEENYNRNKAKAEARKAAAEVEAEEAGVINRTELEQEIAEVSQQEEYSRGKFMGVVEKHMERKTGNIHVITAFGLEDLRSGKRYGLPSWLQAYRDAAPVRGYIMTEEMEAFEEGMPYSKDAIAFRTMNSDVAGDE